VSGLAGTVPSVAAWALVLWTLFVWGTRIVNILTDGGGIGALLVAAGLTALAVAAGVSLARVRRLPWAVPALAAATIAVWAVRVPLLLAHDHEAAFVVVHLVLAGVSVALAVGALRAAPVRRPIRAQGQPTFKP
jgi:cytochrome bd-type quinol oxidase subunit 1